MSTQVLKNKKNGIQFKINFNSNFGQKQFKQHLSKEKSQTDRRLSKTHRESYQNVSKSPFRQQTKKNRQSKQKTCLKRQKKQQKQKYMKSKQKEKKLQNVKNKKCQQNSNKKKIHKKSQILTTSPNIINHYESGSRSVSKSKSRSISKSYKKQRSKSQISTSRLNTCRSTMQKPKIKKAKKKPIQEQKVQKTQKATKINSNLKARSRSRINTQRSCYSPLKEKNIFKNSNSNIEQNKQMVKKQTIRKHQQSKSNLQSINIQKTKQKLNNKQKKKQKKTKKQIKKDKESQNYKTIQNLQSKKHTKVHVQDQNHTTIKQKHIVNQLKKTNNIQGEETVSFKKKKNIEIKTQMPVQKYSYFDDSLLKRLQIFHENYGDQLRNVQKQINSSQISQVEIKKCLQNSDYQFRSQCPQTSKKYSDDENPLNKNDNDSQMSSQKNIQFLDHMKLKQNNTINSEQIQKIDQLLKTQNQLNFMQNSDNEQLKQFQIINETLQKIINIQKSQQQNQQLQISHKDKNFFQEFQKQMDEYLIQIKKTQSFKQKYQAKLIKAKFEQSKFEETNISQNQKNEHLFLYDFIENNLIIEFCQSIIKNKKIFHQFLLSINKITINENNIITNSTQPIAEVKLQKQIELQKFQEYLSKRIECTEEYCLILSKELMRYVKQNHLQFILKNVNRSFGMKPLHTLKWMRSLVYGENQQQSVQQQQDDQNRQLQQQESKNQSQKESSDPLQPIISTQILQQFNNHQNEFLFQQISEEQYFFNHAIYNCLNDMLDAFRPFGQQGRPILPILQLPKIKCIDRVLQNVIQNFKQILSIRMGRCQFSIQEEPQYIVAASYKKLDICISEQLQTKWKECNIQDIMFQKKYVIAEHVIDQIFNNEIMMLLSRFQN